MKMKKGMYNDFDRRRKINMSTSIISFHVIFVPWPAIAIKTTASFHFGTGTLVLYTITLECNGVYILVYFCF